MIDTFAKWHRNLPEGKKDADPGGQGGMDQRPAACPGGGLFR
jgi:hypothetical protein